MTFFFVFFLVLILLTVLQFVSLLSLEWIFLRSTMLALDILSKSRKRCEVLHFENRTLHFVPPNCALFLYFYGIFKVGIVYM